MFKKLEDYEKELWDKLIRLLLYIAITVCFAVIMVVVQERVTLVLGFIGFMFLFLLILKE